MAQLNLDRAASGLSALGNPTRLALLKLLVRVGGDGLIVGEMQRRLKVPASTLAHHVATLVDAGLLEQTRHGREVRCRANYAAIRLLADYLLAECCVEGRGCAPRKSG